MTSQFQDWDPERYRTEAGFVAELGRPVLDLLAPAQGERVLDLGCGDGALSLEIARLGAEVIGVDASEEMVRAAVNAGVEAHVGDGAALSFSGEFDAVFSNAALHWIKPPDAAVRGVWQALRPGGRFIGEFGGSGNVATIIHAIEASLRQRGVTVANPWYFPTSDEYTALLEDVGFTVHMVELFSRPTRLPGDVRGWLETFGQHYVSSVPKSEREGLISEIVNELRTVICDTEGNWYADYVRLRFHAEKPQFAP